VVTDSAVPTLPRPRPGRDDNTLPPSPPNVPATGTAACPLAHRARLPLLTCTHPRLARCPIWRPPIRWKVWCLVASFWKVPTTPRCGAASFRLGRWVCAGRHTCRRNSGNERGRHIDSTALRIRAGNSTDDRGHRRSVERHQRRLRRGNPDADEFRDRSRLHLVANPAVICARYRLSCGRGVMEAVIDVHAFSSGACSWKS